MQKMTSTFARFVFSEYTTSLGDCPDRKPTEMKCATLITSVQTCSGPVQIDPDIRPKIRGKLCDVNEAQNQG